MGKVPGRTPGKKITARDSYIEGTPRYEDKKNTFNRSWTRVGIQRSFLSCATAPKPGELYICHVCAVAQLKNDR